MISKWLKHGRKKKWKRKIQNLEDLIIHKLIFLKKNSETKEKTMKGQEENFCTLGHSDSGIGINCVEFSGKMKPGAIN